ncbi:MAG TPA: hypothetical protein VGF62_08995 [Rhizomicrobium sp.]|jgi:hypothetical protein
MKRFAAVVLLLICALATLSAQKTRFGQGLPYAKPGIDYPTQVHISGIRLRTECFSVQDCANTIHADALLGGQKIELSGTSWLSQDVYQDPFLPGNYQARLLKSPHKIDGGPLFQEYELILPDRKVWRCAVTGLFE